MATYQLIAATGCPTGIAHTYMAQEALEQAAKRKGITIKVETHGQIGIEKRSQEKDRLRPKTKQWTNLNRRHKFLQEMLDIVFIKT